MEIEMTRLSPDQIRRNGDMSWPSDFPSKHEHEEAMQDAARMQEWLADDPPPYWTLWPVAAGIAIFAVLVLIGRALL
jgi:hypothetical protein